MFVQKCFTKYPVHYNLLLLTRNNDNNIVSYFGTGYRWHFGWRKNSDNRGPLLPKGSSGTIKWSRTNVYINNLEYRRKKPK